MKEFLDLVGQTLRDHQLYPVVTKDGRTVWRCPTCGLDVPADAARLGEAQCAHQASEVLAAIRDA